MKQKKLNEHRRERERERVVVESAICWVAKKTHNANEYKEVESQRERDIIGKRKREKKTKKSMHRPATVLVVVDW